MEAMEAGTLVAEKYRLVRQIGRGGMGAVWAAQNLRTEREVALKLITDENADYRERLLREARACGRIAHRNVIEIYDVGETASGAPFLVMPLLEGEPLSRKLRRDGAIAPPFAAQIASDIGRALAAAHAVGIIHRDLKPANIYLHHEPGSDSLVVKVLDFGISKVVESDSTTTTTGTILGSPAYMSPEQARGERYIDHRSDLWALGVTLFEMLTGKRPFQGESMFTVVAAVLDGPIPHVLHYAPHIDPRLADVVARCMTRELDWRLQSGQEIVELLRSFVSGYLPANFSGLGHSGVHPMAHLSQGHMPHVVGDSASVPPVHFAVPQPGMAHPMAPPAPMAAPHARGSLSSVESISLHTAHSVSGAPALPHARPSSTPEPFSGSTTAAGAMVHAAPGPPAPPPWQQPYVAPPPRSRALLWVLGVVAFVALAVLTGTVIGLSASGDRSAQAGDGDGDTKGSGAAHGGSRTSLNTGSPKASVEAPTATETPKDPEPEPSVDPTPDVSAEPSAQPVTNPVAGPRPQPTVAKPPPPVKTGKPTSTGVSVPDDPG